MKQIRIEISDEAYDKVEKTQAKLRLEGKKLTQAETIDLMLKIFKLTK